MTNEEALDLGLKYNPGLSFGDIPHLYWKDTKYPSPDSRLEQAIPTIPDSFRFTSKRGVFFCRAQDRDLLKTLFHINLDMNSWVFPQYYRINTFDYAFKPYFWDIWVYNGSWNRMVSIRTMFSSDEEVDLSETNKIALCSQLHMPETFYPLFQTFHKTWSPKSSLAYMARLASV